MEITHPDPNRLALLERLVILANKYPQLRIFQLIGNATPPVEALRLHHDMYYVGDREFLQWLDDYEKQNDEQAARMSQ